jgi:hypothetical protein
MYLVLPCQILWLGKVHWKECGASVKVHSDISITFRVNDMVRNYIKYTTEKT